MERDSPHSIIETVKAPVTASEKRLLDVISKAADRIATFAHLGQREFSIEDVLDELDCDYHAIKRLMRDSAAEILKEQPDISAVQGGARAGGVVQGFVRRAKGSGYKCLKAY